MHGNVWEWCADAAENNDSMRVVEGGSFLENAENCAFRNSISNREKSKTFPDVGFRVVLIPSSR